MAKDIDIKIVVNIDPVWTTSPMFGRFPTFLPMGFPASWCTPSRIRTTEGINVTEEFERIEERELVERLERRSNE